MNVYCHIPFCRSKCGYCAFYSEAAAPAAWRTRYLAKLERDLAAADWSEQRVETLYLGGGTPSLLTETELEHLFTLLRRRLPLAAGAEISMECNPETLSAAKVELIRSFVTRLSLGVQSFSAERRRLLQRDCSDPALERALNWIAEARFPHFNCDLIYGLPGERLERWERDLERARATGADHLSCYALTPEEGTHLAGIAVDDDLAAAAYERIVDVSGLPRYEISNYARLGAECRHNLAVWHGGELRGFGPAAASFERGLRWREVESLSGWLRGDPPETDPLPPEARCREIAVVGLRTAAGWTPELFEAIAVPDREPYNWDWLLRESRKAAAGLPGCWHCSPERIALTPLGLRFWDSVAAAFLQPGT